MEILEESEAFPSALPVRRDLAWSAWVTIQIGCDNNCAFCIVPAVRGAEISRPFEEVVAEVEQLAAAGVRGGHPARPERQLLRARPRPGRAPGRPGRAGPAPVRRPAPGRRGGRGHPPGALHEPPPEGPPARDDRGHGRDRDGVRAPPPAPPGRERPDAGRHAPGLHGRRATSSGWPRPGPACPTWPSPPTSSSASRARRTTTSSARSRSWPRPATTAPTPSCSAPVRAPRPSAGRRPGARPGVAAERFERLRVVVERSALAAHRARVGGWRRCSSRARAARTPTCSRAAPARTSSSTSARRRRSAPAPSPTSGSPGPPRTTSRGDLVAVTARPRHRTTDPCRRRLSPAPGRRTGWALDFDTIEDYGGDR